MEREKLVFCFAVRPSTLAAKFYSLLILMQAG